MTGSGTSAASRAGGTLLALRPPVGPAHPAGAPLFLSAPRPLVGLTFRRCHLNGHSTAGVILLAVRRKSANREDQDGDIVAAASLVGLLDEAHRRDRRAVFCRDGGDLLRVEMPAE